MKEHHRVVAKRRSSARALAAMRLFHWNGSNSTELDSGGSNGYSISHFDPQEPSK